MASTRNADRALHGGFPLNEPFTDGVTLRGVNPAKPQERPSITGVSYVASRSRLEPKRAQEFETPIHLENL